MQIPSDSTGPNGFDFQPLTRLIFGENAVARVGDLARELGGKRALIVTDAGLVTAGHPARVEHALQAAGLGVVTYEKVRENPTTRDVDQCLAVARAAGFPRVVSFDMGGTSTDVSVVDDEVALSNDARIGDFPVRLPMIDILTVGAGGGSIAHLDSGGAMLVGPRSAGAVPGPAC